MLLLLVGTLLRHFKEHFLESLLFISAEESHLDASTPSCCESTFWVCTVLRQACLLGSVLGKTVKSGELTA